MTPARTHRGDSTLGRFTYLLGIGQDQWPGVRAHFLQLLRALNLEAPMRPHNAFAISATTAVAVAVAVRRKGIRVATRFLA